MVFSSIEPTFAKFTFIEEMNACPPRLRSNPRPPAERVVLSLLSLKTLRSARSLTEFGTKLRPEPTEILKVGLLLEV